MDAGAVRGRLHGRSPWLRDVLYALFVVTPFSIAGVELASLLLLALATAHLLRSEPVAWPPRWVVLPFALFGAACLLSALANPEPLRNLTQLGPHYRLLLPFAMLPALAVVDRRALLAVLAAGVVVVSLYGVTQFFSGVDWVRPEGEKLVSPSQIEGASVFHAKGTFSHHLTYAGFLLIQVPFFLALFLSDGSRARWLWLGASLAATAGLVASMARSGWLGATLGLGLLALRLPRRYALPLVVGGVTTGVLLAVSLATGWLQATFARPDNPVLVKRILETSLERDADRLYMWEAGWLGFRAHPVLGIGLGNDQYDWDQYRRIVAERHGGHRYRNPPRSGVHNLYLQIAYELGAVGVLAYLLLMGTLFAWCALGIRRAAPADALGSGILWGTAAGLGGSMLAACFENNFFDAEVQNLLAILFGLALHAGVDIRSRAA